ncbi:HlyD family efflux transporter periplasmic adaptor subunit [Methyloceanibacter sp.]|uniref:HlyD family efflux transporter periplasmic adaptor subunit n=1 Tax=Methyloceanibacter sp. TaxID=1965321 RepID=UPI003D6C85C6
MAQGWGSRRLWTFVGLAALLGYVAWIGAPYLRSVVVRDAAVTTWINTTAAPIDGFLGSKPLHVGDSVGKGGLIATIENPLQDATPVVRAEADLNKAKQHVRGLQELMTGLEAAAAARAAMELADAKVEAESAEKILASVKSAYETAKFQPVKAPPDAYVWSLIAASGDFVRAGSPVATWVDCSFMLVDVPVSDVELALLRTDAPARIVLEGDPKVRDGKVYLTRGAAATIGADDLAALAKGRHAGIGQVLVQFEPSAADIWECPIGAAAYVDFPDIGILDILRARLRL